MMSDNKAKIKSLQGKVSTFEKNTKAKEAYDYLENVKISKRKLWYFIIERDSKTDAGEDETQLQMIKYNNKQGVNCTDFIKDLRKYYEKNEVLKPLVENLIVEGTGDFSIIRNIPNVKIDEIPFITIITKDLIKLLK